MRVSSQTSKRVKSNGAAVMGLRLGCSGDGWMDGYALFLIIV